MSFLAMSQSKPQSNASLPLSPIATERWENEGGLVTPDPLTPSNAVRAARKKKPVMLSSRRPGPQRGT